MNELINTIKENVPKVYDAGHKAGVEEGYNKCLEENDMEIAELIALQEEYIALGGELDMITFYVPLGTELTVKFTCRSGTTWEEAISQNLVGINTGDGTVCDLQFNCGVTISEDNYVLLFLIEPLVTSDQVRVKASDIIIANEEYTWI